MVHFSCNLMKFSIFYQPAVRVLLYTRHREGAARETLLASCAQAPCGSLAVRQGAFQSARSVPPAVPWRKPHQARPTPADCGDETLVHGAGTSTRILSIAAGCTAVLRCRGGLTMPRCRGTPHIVPSVHLAGTLLTTEAACGRFWLQHRHMYVITVNTGSEQNNYYCHYQPIISERAERPSIKMTLHFPK